MYDIGQRKVGFCKNGLDILQCLICFANNSTCYNLSGCGVNAELARDVKRIANLSRL